MLISPKAPASATRLRQSFRDRLRKSVRLLGDLEPRSETQISVVESLLDGPKTIAELTEEIFGTDSADQASYMKVRRAVRALGSKGYVSTRLLGKPKPYRLTLYAREMLGSLEPGLPPFRLLAPWDILLHGATLVVATILALDLVDSLWWLLVFVYLAGASSCRLAQLFRRVS